MKDFNYTKNISKIKNCSLIFINTCGVKEQTETKIIRFLRKIISEKIDCKKIIIYGCLVDINKEKLKEEFPNIKLFSIKDKEQLQNLFKLKISKSKKIKQKLTVPIIIANGCLGNCSYCAVKFARGKLKSKSISEIKNEILVALEKGAKEILLTAQDTVCYGFDINTNIIKLLKEILKIKKDFKIRLGMANPKYLYKFKTDLIKIYKNKKMYKLIHMPIQSGSNRILKLMNRAYDAKLINNLALYFRNNIKDITIATDVIIGFPTETQEEFLDTCKIIEKNKFDIVNISRFGKRKNTEASKYKDFEGRIKKQRSRIITKLCEDISLQNNSKYLGDKKEIIINEIGKNKTEILGRSYEYKQILIKDINKLGQKQLLQQNQKQLQQKDLKKYFGKKIKVKITDFKTYYLIGKII
ncbi:MAG: tRNA (N(6)-L-threonylcarbamoyladenosine(37)-C(2))-methylthiotransferase [archaeon]